MNITTQITNWVKADTEDRWLVSRLGRSIHTVAQKKGYPTALLMASSISVIKAYALAVACFTSEGSARALIDLANNNSTDLVRLRSLGDSGGWSALTVFSLFGASTIIMKCIREGEYLRLKDTLNKWYRQNQESITEDPIAFKNLYQRINDLLDTCQSQCLFQKSLVSRRLTALEILENLPVKSDFHSKHHDLKNIFENIHTNLENATSMRYYFHRLYDGQRAVVQNGISRGTTSLVMGVALPIILILTAICSYVGEVGLGKELFIDKEELTDVGHFGEWPINAVEALFTALVFHLWFMINEGDFLRTRQVYQTQLDELRGQRLQQNRIAKIANEELKDLSGGCAFFKLPGEYQCDRKN